MCPLNAFNETAWFEITRDIYTVILEVFQEKSPTNGFMKQPVLNDFRSINTDFEGTFYETACFK